MQTPLSSSICNKRNQLTVNYWKWKQRRTGENPRLMRSLQNLMDVFMPAQTCSDNGPSGLPVHACTLLATVLLRTDDACVGPGRLATVLLTCSGAPVHGTQPKHLLFAWINSPCDADLCARSAAALTSGKAGTWLVPFVEEAGFQTHKGLRGTLYKWAIIKAVDRFLLQLGQVRTLPSSVALPLL